MHNEQYFYKNCQRVAFHFEGSNTIEWELFPLSFCHIIVDENKTETDGSITTIQLSHAGRTCAYLGSNFPHVKKRTIVAR